MRHKTNPSQDYYPFGMLMSTRTWDAESSYRFGFNTQERVDEISGKGNHNTALFWEYDTRLGRRWNLDPKPQIFISDYAVNGNNPIYNFDIDGDKFVNYDKDGKFVNITKDNFFHNLLHGTKGRKFDEKGNLEFKFKFGDKRYVGGLYNESKKPQNIDAQTKTDRIVVLDQDIMFEEIENAGVFNENNQKNKKDFIKNESHNGSMDYANQSKILNYKKSETTLFIVKYGKHNAALDRYNAGNFMWGAGAKALGFARFIARLGAHWDVRQNTNYFKDSHDDQLSIKYGHKWMKKRLKS